MQTATHQNAEAVKRESAPTFVPLDHETRATVDTETAAFHLNRRPQTLRAWACLQTYPVELKPIRVSGRLAWPVAGLRTVLGVVK